MIEITNEFLQYGSSDEGTLTRFQLALIGVEWPPKKDWKRCILGKFVADEVANTFLIWRDIVATNDPKLGNKQCIVIDEVFILRGRSNAGGWSRYQLRLLGVEWPPQSGWKRRIIGTTIPDEVAAEFLRAKSRVLTKSKSRAKRDKVAKWEKEEAMRLRGTGK